MADPLSLSSGIAGLVSLGIEVCKGIIWYFDSVKGRKKDLENELRDVLTVQHTFHALRELEPHILLIGPEHLEALRLSLRDAQQTLEDLKNVLDKLRDPTSSSGLMAKAKHIGNAAIYPFRQRDLASLRKRAQWIRHNLQLALQAASTKLDVVQHHNMTEILQKLNDGVRAQTVDLANLNTVANDTFDKVKAIDSNRQSDFNHLSNELAKMTWLMESLVQGQQQSINGRLTMVQSNASRTAHEGPVPQAALVELFQKADEIPGLPIHLSQRREYAYEHTAYGSSSSTPIESRELVAPSDDRFGRRKAMFPTSCACKPSKLSNSRDFNLWGLKFTFSDTSYQRHSKGCQLYGISHMRERSIGTTVPFYLSWFLGRYAHASITYATGSGNLGMSIRSRYIVEGLIQGPFSRVDNATGLYDQYPRRSIVEIVSALKDFKSDILALYRDGKASPSDRDKWGGSYLAGSLFLMNILIARYDSSEVTAASLRILRTLVDADRGDDNEINLFTLIDGGTLRTGYPLLYSESQSWFLNVARAVPMTHPFKPLIKKDPYNALSTMPTLLYELELAEIYRAILLRSMEYLNDVIARYPLSTLEKTHDATVLHHAVFWPEGLQRLLDTHAHELINSSACDFQGYTPLLLALSHNYAASVNILMRHGATLEYDWAGHYHRIDVSNECIAVLAEHFAARRWNLFDLAREECNTPWKSEVTYVPDEEACPAQQLLEEIPLAIPQILQVPDSYQTISLEPSTQLHHFPIYYEYGFRSLHIRDECGLTLAMMPKYDYFQYVNRAKTYLWLHEKGMLGQRLKDTKSFGLSLGATGWHHIAASWLFRNEIQIIESPPKRMASVLSELTIDDSCTCWCNQHGKGCSPLKFMWKSSKKSEFIDEIYVSGPFSVLYGQMTKGQLIRHIIIHFPAWAINDDEQEQKDLGLSNLALEFVRLISFEALDMTHTCCSFIHLDDSERAVLLGGGRCSDHAAFPVLVACNLGKVQRIRRDRTEQESARELDSLMEEFSHEMKSLDTSPLALEAFIWGYWRRRISKFYDTKLNVVQDMEQVVTNFRSHVVPESLAALLGDDFDFLQSDRGDGAHSSTRKDIDGREALRGDESGLGGSSLDSEGDSSDNETDGESQDAAEEISVSHDCILCDDDQKYASSRVEPDDWELLRQQVQRLGSNGRFDLNDD